MTDKQQRFAEEYLIDSNATQAAIRAGYPANSAKEKGYQLLQDSEVAQYLSELRVKQQLRTNITADRVLLEVSRIAFSDIRTLYDDNGFLKLPKDLSDDTAAALASIEIDEIWGFDLKGDKQKMGETKKVKLNNKLEGLEKLMKHLGLYSKDNLQKGTQINTGNLTDEELQQFINLSKKAIATDN